MNNISVSTAIPALEKETVVVVIMLTDKRIANISVQSDEVSNHSEPCEFR